MMSNVQSVGMKRAGSALGDWGLGERPFKVYCRGLSADAGGPYSSM
jgi:hypothetical protein